MGLIFRRTKRVGDTDVNVSKGGASLSCRIGRRLRVNSRGGGSFRLGRRLRVNSRGGGSFRLGRRLRVNSRGGGSFRLGRGISWRFGRRR
jgi:hypothetical protein